MLFIRFQTTNERFVQEKQSGQAVSEREAKLKELATAHDSYMELTANLKEGTKVGDLDKATNLALNHLCINKKGVRNVYAPSKGVAC